MRNGYRRAATVREAGEYAFRGGIVDVFPPGAPEPYRLDFFGDELETIRTFDPMSQRTTGNEEAFALGPVSEIAFDDASNERFREGYRRLFGPPSGPDPLYEAVSAGAHHPGVEHWLPLFHERISTLFDYVPDAIMSLDHETGGSCPLSFRDDRGFLRCPGRDDAVQRARCQSRNTGISSAAQKDALSNRERMGRFVEPAACV